MQPKEVLGKESNVNTQKYNIKVRLGQAFRNSEANEERVEKVETTKNCKNCTYGEHIMKMCYYIVSVMKHYVQ